MNKTISLFALFLFTCASCSRHEPPAAKPAVADHSLSVAEYMAKGLPATDRPWFAPDYQKALEVLNALPMDQLPRNSSRNSAAVLARITDPVNLEFYANRSLPLQQRLATYLDMCNSANTIGKIYTAAQSNDPIFGEDTIQILGFLLHAATVQIGLLDELLPTLDKADPSYSARMAGLEKVKTGLAQVIQGALVTLEERQAYSSNARARLATIIVTTFPIIAPQLPPLSRKEFENRLQRMAQEETDSSIKVALAGGEAK